MNNSLTRSCVICLFGMMLAAGPALSDDQPPAPGSKVPPAATQIPKKKKKKKPVAAAAADSQAALEQAPAQPVVPPPEIHLNNELQIIANSVTGDGKARSSLSDGLHDLDILSLYGSRTTSNGYFMTYNVGVKITDDRANDIKNFSFTNLQARWTNSIKTYAVGDVLEYYSQYSLNSALKGISYRYDATEADKAQLIQHLGLIYGISYPRWDCFTGDSQVKAIMRNAYGATARGDIAPGLTGGLSLVYTADSGRVAATDSLFAGEVLAFDSEYQPFSELTIRDEIALSGITESPGGNSDISHNDVALRAEAVGSGGPSRVSLEYERVGTKFVTTLGAATPDRERIKGKWRYKYDSDITTNCSLLLYHNNLDGSKAATISATQPEFGVTVKSPFNRDSAAADVFYRIFTQNGGGTTTNDNSLGLAWRDRFGRYDSDSNLSYTMYDTESNVTKNKELTFNTSLSTTQPYKNAMLRPTVSLGIWNMTDDLLSKTNQITEYSVGSAIEVPDSNVVSHIRVGQNSLNGQIGDSSDKFFASGDIYYRLRTLKNAQAYIRFFYNSYSFTTTANNYRESSITTGLTVQY